MGKVEGATLAKKTDAAPTSLPIREAIAKIGNREWLIVSSQWLGVSDRLTANN